MNAHRAFDELSRLRTRLAAVEAALRDAQEQSIVEFEEIAELRAGRASIRARIAAVEAEANAR